MYDVTTAKLFLLDMDGTFYLDADAAARRAGVSGTVPRHRTAVCVFNEQFLQKQSRLSCEAHAPGRGRYRT